MTRYYKQLFWLGVGHAYVLPRRIVGPNMIRLRTLSLASSSTPHENDAYDTVISVSGRVAVFRSELEPGSRVSGVDSGAMATILLSRSSIALGLIDESTVLIPGELIQWEENNFARIEENLIFQDGPKQEELKRIDQFLETGVPFIDAVTPIGKGQSCLFVGPTSALSNCREAAIRAVRAQSPDEVTCIVAQLDDQMKQYPDNTRILETSLNCDVLEAQCNALLTTHSALALGTKIMRSGRDALVILDTFAPLLSLWRRCALIGESTTTMSSRILDKEIDSLGADSECRAFFSSILQRSGRLKKGGSLAIISIACADPNEQQINQSTPVQDKVYTVADFKGARNSILTRLRLLEERGVALTTDVLSKIGLRPPETVTNLDITVAPLSARRAEAVEMLTSIADAHVEFLPGHTIRIDPALSLQRVGVGADTGFETRPMLSRKLALGSPLRLFLTQDNIDQRQNNRAAAWTHALAIPASSESRKNKEGFSRIALTAIAIKKGYLDSIPINEVPTVLENLILNVREDPACAEACAFIDINKDSTDQHMSLLTSAIESFFSSSSSVL
mmetsp:Transcript_23824/g.31010  ORF Transcript_23824/g.31010 Transcript_23824/m.31010 type:complete len:563 (+) Transcript_23824:84-1772(+)|eukprot:CAMPEP_0197297112 /NCGR_PEP_ID=MMETSP0890-20130614/40150_1 /TAXON_ID=44058 ORGANISM="Aureoumbra lagunensis, Strain CCMP1510" /NCGR_SAMPLE_ID=MMETSP0890 /ASSEMBLY_ACC=CAM_ASM_000533 /LENGTH=562 /DNA_ID=CAMNT_0042774059 /DNA_START=62 /DNA_END=1750 /DNA_ORIENTATION=+